MCDMSCIQIRHPTRPPPHGPPGCCGRGIQPPKLRPRTLNALDTFSAAWGRIPETQNKRIHCFFRAKPLAMAGHDTELKPVGRFGNTTHLLVLAAAQQIPRILVGRGHTPHARPSILLRCTPKTKNAYCPMPGCVALTQMLKEQNTTS